MSLPGLGVLIFLLISSPACRRAAAWAFRRRRLSHRNPSSGISTLPAAGSWECGVPGRLGLQLTRGPFRSSPTILARPSHHLSGLVGVCNWAPPTSSVSAIWLGRVFIIPLETRRGAVFSVGAPQTRPGEQVILCRAEGKRIERGTHSDSSR